MSVRRGPGVLPFPQEHPEPPSAAPSPSLPQTLPAGGDFAAAVDSGGLCSRAPAEHGSAEKRRGGRKKEIPQEVQIFYYFLFVQSMSTLGTRCAICLELRCQLDRMSFFFSSPPLPDLTQKELEHKEKELGGDARGKAPLGSLLVSPLVLPHSPGGSQRSLPLLPPPLAGLCLPCFSHPAPPRLLRSFIWAQPELKASLKG